MLVIDDLRVCRLIIHWLVDDRLEESLEAFLRWLRNLMKISRISSCHSLVVRHLCSCGDISWLRFDVVLTKVRLMPNSWLIWENLRLNSVVIVCCCRFLILVEIHHLGQKLVRNLVEGSHLVRSDSYLDSWKLSHDGLKLRIVYSSERLDNLKIIVDNFLLIYCLFHRCEMFLIRQIYMVEKWTLAG